MTALTVTRPLLALVGLITLLSVAWPSSRDTLLQHIATLAVAADSGYPAALAFFQVKEKIHGLGQRRGPADIPMQLTGLSLAGLQLGRIHRHIGNGNLG